MHSKAQAGIEYLLTYAWALVLVAVIVGILTFVMTDTSSQPFFKSNDPLKILIKGGSADSLITKIVLQNSSGGQMVLNEIVPSENYSPDCNLNGSNFIQGTEIKAGQIVKIDCFRTGESAAGSITLKYDDYAGLQKKTVIDILGGKKKPPGAECLANTDCPSKDCYSSFCSVNNNCEFEFSGEPGCVGCGTVISEDGTTLVLENDLLNCKNFGIMIDAANVTIDCAGHEITGSSDLEVYDSSGKEYCSIGVFDQKVYPSGIVICRGEGGKYTIRNCVIHENFSNSIYGGGIANYDQHTQDKAGLIENNRFYNLKQGIMEWGEFDTIRNNVFENNGTGIWLDESSGTLLENNRFVDNNIALNHYCGPYCKYKQYPSTIANNVFEDNGIAMKFWKSNTGYINDIVTGNQFIDSTNSGDLFEFTSNAYQRNYWYEGVISILRLVFREGVTPSIDSTNTLNGDPIYVFINEDLGGMEISGRVGGFYCLSCSNVSLRNAVMNTGKYGLVLIKTSGISVEDSSIKNHRIGAVLFETTNTQINASFENNDFSFADMPVEGSQQLTNEFCNQSECYSNYCSEFSGMKDVIGTQCTDNGCASLEFWCDGADANEDGTVDETDQDLFMAFPLNRDCGFSNNWCSKTDITLDGFKSMGDFGKTRTWFGETDCDSPEKVRIFCYLPTPF